MTIPRFLTIDYSRMQNILRLMGTYRILADSFSEGESTVTIRVTVIQNGAGNETRMHVASNLLSLYR